MNLQQCCNYFVGHEMGHFHVFVPKAFVTIGVMNGLKFCTMGKSTCIILWVLIPQVWSNSILHLHRIGRFWYVCVDLRNMGLWYRYHASMIKNFRMKKQQLVPKDHDGNSPTCFTWQLSYTWLLAANPCNAWFLSNFNIYNYIFFTN